MIWRDFINYYEPAMANLISQGEYLGRRGDRALGLRKRLGLQGKFLKVDDELPESLIELLKLLAGPHGRTILKMVEARGGWTDDR